MNIDPAFDGHSERHFSEMTAEERLDDLSRKIALMLELRKSVAASNRNPHSQRLDTPREGYGQPLI